jgi:Rrf2 family nitric oxide-sensitive transcriptional repressor
VPTGIRHDLGLDLHWNRRLITQTAEYALRAAVYLADQTEPRTTNQIAKQTQVPAGYLSKVMQALGKAGIVRAQRGLHGGFLLATDAAELSVLEVVQSVEPVRRIHECPLGLHGKNLCPLHRKLDDAAKMIEESFADTSIADLNNAPRSRKPLCSFPHDA